MSDNVPAGWHEGPTGPAGPPSPPNGPAGGDLGATYPNPTVVALHETSGPTKLTVGTVVDGEFLKRVGSTIVSAAGTGGGGSPTGSAGGDLGGTYPNPTVTALHETSGPTKLTLGVVADGDFLIRSGSTLVGGVPTDPFFQTVKDSAGASYQTDVVKFANGTITTVGGETVVTLGSGVEIDAVGSGLTLTTGTLTNDLLTGKAGGQTVTGDTASAGNLDLRSTSHATKGLTRIGGTTGLVYDEVNKRLGIGVSPPTAAFQLGTTDLATVLLGSFQAGVLSLQSASGYCGMVVGKDTSTFLYLLQHSSGDAVLAASGKLLIQSGGSNILVIDAAHGLSGSQGAGGALLLNSTTSATKGKIFFGIAENSAYDDGNDRLGLGTPSPAVQLHTTGAVRFANFGAGAATFDASGNISSVSDERLKDVVAPYTSALAALASVRPILYRWRPESGLETEHVYAGFSAQNVQQAMPEAVGRTPDGFLSLQDRALLAACVNAINELAARLPT